MLGRGVQLTCRVQTPGEETITDSAPASYYLKKALLHDSYAGVLPAALERIRNANQDGSYLWRDLLTLQVVPKPDLSLINLESSVTRTIRTNDISLMKGITYHFHCDNLVGVLSTLVGNTPYVISYANNHVMDFGRSAFEDESLPMLQHLPRNGQMVGAGRTLNEAAAPVNISCQEGAAQVMVIAAGTECAGVPPQWAASETTSGILFLPPLVSEQHLLKAMSLAYDYFSTVKKQNTVLILSLHFGPNWVLREPYDKAHLLLRQRFARWTIDALGVDLVYGHSSHHIAGLELYNRKLIIYGCGDLVNDYEGFSNPGDEAYNKMGAVFIIDLHPHTGEFHKLRLVPTLMDRLRVCRWKRESSMWNPTERVDEQIPHGAEDLARAVNIFSYHYNQTDPVILSVVEHDDNVPGGPVLVFPK